MEALSVVSQLSEVRSSGYNICLLTGYELAEEARLTTGCAILDSALRGGVPTCGIVEISGESGSGKTQLCLQLSLTAQWPASSCGLAAGECVTVRSGLQYKGEGGDIGPNTTTIMNSNINVFIYFAVVKML